MIGLLELLCDRCLASFGSGFWKLELGLVVGSSEITNKGPKLMDPHP